MKLMLVLFESTSADIPVEISYRICINGRVRPGRDFEFKRAAAFFANNVIRTKKKQHRCLFFMT